MAGAILDERSSLVGQKFDLEAYKAKRLEELAKNQNRISDAIAIFESLSDYKIGGVQKIEAHKTPGVQHRAFDFESIGKYLRELTTIVEEIMNYSSRSKIEMDELQREATRAIYINDDAKSEKIVLLITNLAAEISNSNLWSKFIGMCLNYAVKDFDKRMVEELNRSPKK